MKALVTGGAGFIGSAVIRHLVQRVACEVINLDKLTYAGNPESLALIADNPRYHFVKGDIKNADLVGNIFAQFNPNFVIHLAAESHVDRSIDGPDEFIHTNVFGTMVMLKSAHAYWKELKGDKKSNFRFLHVSTDEVYGSLGEKGLFTEETRYDPSSPYSASKAGSDHLVRAWERTFGLPTVITNCSNNYGPYQFPEKLIPLVILNAIERKPLPVYGDGQQIRDWLYVEDHVRALYKIVTEGKIGDTYNIGGRNEMTNIEVVHAICALLDEFCPDTSCASFCHQDLITYVKDRPGHDQRYAIDASKIGLELDWYPKETFETGLRKTVEWYLNNKEWSKHVLDGTYQRERLGIARAEKGKNPE